MKVLIVGAGPAGLASATLLGGLDSVQDITVIERSAANADPGGGITLRTSALSFLGLESLLDVRQLKGRSLACGGEVVVDLPYPSSVGCATVSRRALLCALRKRYGDMGGSVQFGVDGSALRDVALDRYDLVVAADGCNSAIRQTRDRAFGVSTTSGENLYSWLTTDTPFENLTILVADGDVAMLGWAYRYEQSLSTLIVECGERALRRSGLIHRSSRDICEALQNVFQQHLRGASVGCHGPRPVASLRDGLLRAVERSAHRSDRRRSAHHTFLARLRHDVRVRRRHCAAVRPRLCDGCPAGTRAVRSLATSEGLDLPSRSVTQHALVGVRAERGRAKGPGPTGGTHRRALAGQRDPAGSDGRVGTARSEPVADQAPRSSSATSSPAPSTPTEQSAMPGVRWRPSRPGRRGRASRGWSSGASPRRRPAAATRAARTGAAMLLWDPLRVHQWPSHAVSRSEKPMGGPTLCP